MAEKTLVALYDDFENAVQAVRDLEAAGFQHKNIGLVANNAATCNAAGSRDGEAASQASDAAGTGAVIGTIAGGGVALLASLGVLAIPGIGPVLAAGPIIATIAGAGVGAAAGGLMGGLAGLGVPEEEEQAYAEGVRRGGALITARVGEAEIGRAIQILERHDAVDVEQRRAGWARNGWSGFDDKAEPWTVSRIDEERVHWKTGGAAGPVTAAETTGAGMSEALTSGAGQSPTRASPGTSAATSGPPASSVDASVRASVGLKDSGQYVGTEPSSDRGQGRPTEPKDAEPGVPGASGDDAIDRLAERESMQGGPQVTAMRGMSAPAQEDRLRAQEEPLKRGDTGRGRVRSYGGASDARVAGRSDAEMDRRAAGDKPSMDAARDR